MLARDLADRGDGGMLDPAFDGDRMEPLPDALRASDELHLVTPPELAREPPGTGCEPDRGARTRARASGARSTSRTHRTRRRPGAGAGRWLPLGVSWNSRPSEKISSAWRNAMRPLSVRTRFRPCGPGASHRGRPRADGSGR